MNRILLAILVANATIAIASDDVGVYFDTSGIANCVQADYGNIIPAYVVLSNCSLSDVGGFELSLSSSSNILVNLAVLPSGGRNYGTYPELRVGYHTPIPTGEIIVLAELSVLVLGSGDVSIGGIENPSIVGAGGPIIASGDANVLIEATLIRENPVAVINSNSCDGYVDGGQVGSTSVQFVSLGLQEIVEADYRVVFTHGSDQNQFGYTDVQDGMPLGIADFDVDEVGYTYVIDHVNGRIVVLDQSLQWVDEIVLPLPAYRIKCDNSVYLEMRDRTIMRVEQGKLHDAGLYAGFEQGVILQKGSVPLEISGSRLSPVEFDLSFVGNRDGKRFELPRWRLSLDAEAAGVALAVGSIVTNRLFLRVAYDLGNYEFAGSVYRVSLDGTSADRLDLPNQTDVRYRLPNSAKVGLGGDLVAIKVYSDRTEVYKWNAF